MDALESRIQVLSHQNQRLAIQLEEKRQNTKLLEDRLAGLEAREQEYAQTLLCVNRLWQQLDSDVLHMLQLAQLSGGTCSGEKHIYSLNLALPTGSKQLIFASGPSWLYALSIGQQQTALKRCYFLV